jgi:hypothetical protein
MGQLEKVRMQAYSMSSSVKIRSLLVEQLIAISLTSNGAFFHEEKTSLPD